MTERYDAIVIGAGHNGLTCAALLAKAGRRVLVLEANAQVGGAAVTRKFGEDCSVPACAHLVFQLQPEVVKALGIRPDLSDELTTIALAENGEHVRMTADSVDGVSSKDRDAYGDFRRRMQRFADLLAVHLNRRPPRLGVGNRRDVLSLARLGFDLRRLGRRDMREFLRVIGMNIYDELVERFDGGTLKGSIALDAVLGTHLGPRSPNTMMTYLYRLAGGAGRVRAAAGGIGELSEAFAQAARAAGATIRTRMPVERILVRTGRVVGVETANGEQFESLCVISNADPKRTVLELLGAPHVEAGFVRRVQRLRARGNAAKLHFAIDGLPTIGGLSRDDLRGRIVIAPDENYVERAFNPAKYGAFSAAPVVELTVPSLHDESLATNGKHVLSVIVQYAPYAIDGGWDADARARFESVVIDTIANYSPGFERSIVASELLTPVDIEAEFHISGGHWHHAELALDQFMFVRPVVGAAQYRLPIDGLYLCGAGTHPGGGISGAAGRNAAMAILEREAAH